jgi:O-succinylbenzoic acid--CoA ligase
VVSTENLDVGPGDLVAVALPPGPEWLPVVRDLWEAGAAVLPVDHRLTSRETRAVLDRARPRVVLDAAGPMIDADALPVSEAIGLCMATSGTRGEPKVVELSRRALETAVHASIEALGGHADDPWLCCTPVAHIGGMLVLLRGVIAGAPVEIAPRFDVETIGSSPHVYTAIVPTMLQRARAAGATIVSTYGLTETCGGVAYEGVLFRDTAVRFGPEREIQLAGPTVMEGYRCDPQSTAEAFTLDGWLRTGDAGSLDPDGCLRVHGRLDDLITSGAEKIWPQEVESALREHPRVLDVGVAGRPDPEWGMRVVAYVVPEPDLPAPTTQELRDFASDRIARFKAPRDVVFLDALPRTASGKLRRRELPSS